MGVFRHTLAQVEEYKNNEAINQSALKVLISDGIQAFVDSRIDLVRQTGVDLFYEEAKHLVIGTAVDVQITHTEEEYIATHYLSKLIKKPGDKTMSVIHRAYDLAKQAHPLGPDSDLSLFKAQVFLACNEEGYQMNWGKNKTYENDDSRYNAIAKDGAAYWMELTLSEGKQMLSGGEVFVVNSIVNSFKTHPHTNWLFEEADHIDTIYQLPVYFTIEGVPCKGLIDMSRIDHKKQRIFPLDIKTTRLYVVEFPKAIDERRYDIQGAIYKEGLVQSLEAISTLIGKDVTKYGVANMAFVAGSTKKPEVPLIFPLKDSMMQRGTHGGIGSNGQRYIGYIEAVNKFAYWEKFGFSLEDRMRADRGVVPVGTDFDMTINI